MHLPMNKYGYGTVQYGVVWYGTVGQSCKNGKPSSKLQNMVRTFLTNISLHSVINNYVSHHYSDCGFIKTF